MFDLLGLDTPAIIKIDRFTLKSAATVEYLINHEPILQPASFIINIAPHEEESALNLIKKIVPLFKNETVLWMNTNNSISFLRLILQEITQNPFIATLRLQTFVEPQQDFMNELKYSLILPECQIKKLIFICGRGLDFQPIAEALKENKSIIDVYFVNFMPLFNAELRLRHLNSIFQALSASTSEKDTEPAAKNTTLQGLHLLRLPSLESEDEAARVSLNNLLRSNKVLKEFSFEQSHLRGIELLDGLQENSNLSILSLSNNEFDLKSFSSMSDYLPSTLKILDISQKFPSQSEEYNQNLGNVLLELLEHCKSKSLKLKIIFNGYIVEPDKAKEYFKKINELLSPRCGLVFETDYQEYQIYQQALWSTFFKVMATAKKQYNEQNVRNNEYSQLLAPP